MKKIFFLFVMMMGFCLVLPAGAVSEGQKTAISENCDKIKETLRTVQHQDSRTRVYLGRHYETVLSKYITPLNVRLVENTMINSGLMDNQDSFSRTRNSFIIDFIEYQKGLEDLVATDCKTEPENFYNKLVKVRERRNVVESDTVVLKELIMTQLNLVKGLREQL
ncbi:hypothetical protein J5868_00605 [Candidatus Saccharibacteria bacterium]|nr:hypothetical protein [Candidatus Saccharibacteria bacterium]